MALGSTQSLVKMSTRNIAGGKGGRCVRLTTSPPSCAECHEIWEPKPSGKLWATPGLLRDCFTFHRASVLSSFWHWRLQRDVLVEAGFLCNKDAVLEAAIKEAAVSFSTDASILLSSVLIPFCQFTPAGSFFSDLKGSRFCSYLDCRVDCVKEVHRLCCEAHVGACINYCRKKL